MIEIKEVTTNSDLNRFIKFPDSLYIGNKYRVTPIHIFEKETLSRKKNPSFEYCEAKYWLAYKDGKIVGRIAGMINNKFVEIWGQKYGRFGWFDFIDDYEVSGALLSKAEEWVKSKGMTALLGPLGFTDMDMEGMLVEGFNEVGTMAVLYNHPYYLKHMEKHNFVKDVDWLQKEIKVPDKVSEKLVRGAKIVAEKYKVRPLKIKKAKELIPYAKSMFYTLNECFKGLYGFVPLSDTQIEQYTKQYFSFINPEFVCLVVNENSEVVGFGISMPSLSEALIKCKGKLFPFGFLRILRATKKYDTIDMYLNGVRPDYQNKGIHSIYYAELMEAYIKHNVKYAITNPQLEDNVRALLLWDDYEHRTHLRRRSFIKHFS